MLSPPPESQSPLRRLVMPQTSTFGAYEYSRSLSIAHKRRLIGTHRALQQPQQKSPVSDVDGESDSMKVDSPGAGMHGDESKALVLDEQAVATNEDDDVADPDDEDLADEPPYKRVCRGRESALSMALRDTSMTRCVFCSNNDFHSCDGLPTWGRPHYTVGTRYRMW